MVKAAATKTCSKCHTCKPATLFQKNRKQCKSCVADYNRKYHKNNKDKISARGRKYYRKNRDKIATEQRKYYQNNKDKISARERKYYRKNRDKIAAQQREYKQQNKHKVAARERKRRKNDPVYNLLCRLRSRMKDAVKAAGLDKKCTSSSELLGISYQGLKEWLEAQFTEGMTWENRSEWHVDHRVPCTAFDLSVEENQRICFWYKNLQPLWAKDNLQKSNTYTEEDKQTLISAYYNQ